MSLWVGFCLSEFYHLTGSSQAVQSVPMKSVCTVEFELSHLAPNFFQLVSSFSGGFAVKSGFFVLLINKISEALFVFPYLPVEVGKIVPIGEMRRRDGF